MPQLPALPDLTSQDVLTIVLALATMALLALAHAVNSGGLRQVFSCSSIAVGALASLSLFGLDIGQVQWLQLDAPAPAARSLSQGGGWPAGGGNPGAETPAAGGGSTSVIPVVTRASFKPQPKPFDSKPFRDCADCPEMVPVPAGYAKVGTDPGDPRAEPAEQPQRVVSIGYAFALGRTEITIGQYAAFARATSRSMPACREANATPVSLPVQCVSFEDARAYVTWLSDKTGHAYRLPSASEWEYAARAGSDAGAVPANIGPAATAASPAGALPANGFGLQDMAGNVAEIVADCWTPTLAAIPADGAPSGGDCTRRVLKDAAWSELVLWSRPSARRAIPAGLARPGVGFRVAREL